MPKKFSFNKSRLCFIFLAGLFFSNLTHSEIAADEAKKLISQAKSGDQKSLEKLQELAISGDRTAQIYYGLLLLNRRDSQKDQAEGVKWMQQAAKQGHPAAFAYLGQAHANGVGGFPVSQVRAAALFSYAANKGLQAAKKEEDKLQSQLSPDQIDKYQALVSRMLTSNNPLADVEAYTDAPAQKTVAQVDVPKNGLTWYDGKTGLTWTVCAYGEVLINNICSSLQEDGGKAVNLRWFDAFTEVQKTTYEGYSDWRIPTLPETLTILKCKTMSSIDRTGRPVYKLINLEKSAQGYFCPPDSYGRELVSTIKTRNSFWTSSSAISYGYSYKRADYDSRKDEEAKFRPRISISNGEIGTTGTDPDITNHVLLVRGGSESVEWKEAISDAYVIKKSESEKESAWKAKVAQDAINYKKQEEKNIEDYKNKKQQYAAEQARLRSSVKAGDRISQGLVLEVKGNLVKVQTYKDVCTLYKSPGVCNTTFGLKTVAAGEEWLRREEITPIWK